MIHREKYANIEDFLSSPDLFDSVNVGRFFLANIYTESICKIIRKKEICDFIFNNRVEKGRIRFVKESNFIDVFNKGVNVHGDTVFRVNAKKVEDAINEGATCIIESYDECNKKLTDICTRINQVFSCGSKANLYLTCGSKSGFGAHIDNHDVIILQLFGSKNWTLWPNEEFGRFYGNNNKGSKIKLTLKQGDALYPSFRS